MNPKKRDFLPYLITSLLAFSSLPAYAQETPPEQAEELAPSKADFTASQLVADKLAVHVEHNYFDWKDNHGGSGRQTITPVTLTYRYNDFDLGWRRAYIESVNTSPDRDGRVSDWSDTSLSFAYTFSQLAWPVRFNMDYNQPNGRATLTGSEKNAIMDGSLVQQTRFGEGENITFGLGVTHAFGEKDVFGAGISTVKRGAFDPNGDVLYDELNPGDEIIGTLQWQHNEERWLVIGGAIYTNSGTTQRGDLDYYEKGDRIDVNLTGIIALTETQKLQASARYSTQSSDQYMNNISGMLEQESANSNGDSFYLSLDWSKTWVNTHTLHVLADYLKIQANSYDQINDLYNAGREKVGIGLGYDYALTPKSQVSLVAKTYEMKDKATPVTLEDTRYNGNNIYVNFSHSF